MNFQLVLNPSLFEQIEKNNPQFNVEIKRYHLEIDPLSFKDK